MQNTIDQPRTDPITLRSITIEQLELEAMLNAAYDALDLPPDATDEQRAEADTQRASIEKALFDYLAANEGAANSKIDGYVAFIKRLEASASVRRQESARIAKLAQTDDAKVKSLKSRLQYYMDETKRPKIETGLYKLSICGNGGKLSLLVNPVYEEMPEKLPAFYRKPVIVPNLDTLRPAAETYKTLVDAYRAAQEALAAVKPDAPEACALSETVNECEARVNNHPCHGIATIADRGKHLRIG